MKKILTLILFAQLFKLCFSQDLSLYTSFGFATADRNFSDVSLGVSLEYLPLDWISIVVGYEKFSSAYNEFGSGDYLFSGIDSYSQFSYSLPTIGFNYYPFIFKRHRVGFGPFVGYGRVMMNKTSRLSYNSELGFNSQGAELYDVEILLGDYSELRFTYGMHFTYSYEILKERLNVNLRLDYTDIIFEDTSRYFTPNILGAKIGIGMYF